MLLKELWKHNKFSFFLLTMFLTAMLFINYKRGLVITPMLQYGMFSEKFQLEDTITTYQIIVDNKQIDLSNYSFTERDLIITPIEDYQKQKKTNPAIYTTMKPFFNKVGLGNFMEEVKYSNQITEIDFNNWYKNKLQMLILTPINNLEIQTCRYVWENNAVKQLSKEKTIF